MQLVAGLGATIFGGSGAAAAGAAATGGFSWLGVAQTIGTAFTAISTIGAGVAQANQMKTEAAYKDFETRDQQIKGDQAAADIKKQLALTLASNKVAFAAGGVDLGSKSAVVMRDQVAHDAEQQLGMAWSNTQREQLKLAAEARRLRSNANTTLFTSLLDAGAGIIKNQLEVAYRG